MNIETHFELKCQQVETAKLVADFIRHPELSIHAEVKGFMLRVIKTDGTQLEAHIFENIVRMLEAA